MKPLQHAPVLALVALLVVFSSCGGRIPTFVQTLEPSWATVEVREDLSYDAAWSRVVDLLVKRFDIQIMSKEDGYIRTNWLYTWTGEVLDHYRVRVTVKFAPNNEKLEIKTEAEYGGHGYWVIGYDTRLLETMKSDLMGTVGRTTR